MKWNEVNKHKPTHTNDLDLFISFAFTSFHFLYSIHLLNAYYIVYNVTKYDVVYLMV